MKSEDNLHSIKFMIQDYPKQTALQYIVMTSSITVSSFISDLVGSLMYPT